jgi:hypothetical protein
VGACALAAIVGADARSAGLAPVARSAHMLEIHDQGNLRFVEDNATQVIDEGHIGGTLPGTARVDFTYNGSPHVSARFTIRGRGGTITGRAQARLSSPTSLAPSFHGALSIVSGTGRYARAHGSGNLYGVFHRRGFGLIFQAIGKLRY